MSALFRARRGAITFALFGVVGPLLQGIFWPPSSWSGWPRIQSTVYGLVTLLWPVRLLASGVEQTTTQLIVLLVLGNLILFAALGAIAGLLSFSPRAVLLLSAGVAAAILFVSRFLVGSFEVAQTWVVVLPVLIAVVVLLSRLKGPVVAPSESIPRPTQ